VKKLWIAFILLASLGSVYPFNFQLAAFDRETLSLFIGSIGDLPSRGDILGNLILFVPIGFTGLLALGRGRKPFIVVLVSGFAVAFGLQVLQMFLPSRDENLQDVIWNMLGLVAGSALACFASGRSMVADREQTQLELVPLTLLAVWFASRLIPFVPSVDWQSIKHSLKPLVGMRFSWAAFLMDVAAWLTAAYLMRHVQRDLRADRWLLWVVLAVLGLEVLIVDNVVDLADVAGAYTAVILWFSIVRSGRYQERFLVALLLVALLLGGLAPFELAATTESFNWLPFQGFLGGSMYLNAQAAAKKVFLYGSLVFLLWRSGASFVAGVGMSVGVVALIEFSQTLFVGHTPEITDPLIVILAGFALVAVRDYESHSLAEARGGGVSGREISQAPKNSNRVEADGWVIEVINLRAAYKAALDHLAYETGRSVSGLIRQIIRDFAEYAAEEAETRPWPSGSLLAANHRQIDGFAIASASGPDRWTRQSVNLRSSQRHFLWQLAKEMNCSVSAVIRKVIAIYVDYIRTDGKQAS
jgi:VanZ family protein/predicted transcriptional regulator